MLVRREEPALSLPGQPYHDLPLSSCTGITDGCDWRHFEFGEPFSALMAERGSRASPACRAAPEPVQTARLHAILFDLVGAV